MRILNFLFIILFSSSVSLTSYSNEFDEQPKVLKLAATSWCPFICDNKAEQGFIVDFLSNLLAIENIQLEVDILPWSRAILLARQGHYDGLLTSTRAEAPDFYFANKPTGTYQMCFYTHHRKDFEYVNRESLQHIILGVIQDYGYGAPLDEIISTPIEGEKIVSIASSTPLHQLVLMSQKKRIEVFIEDKMVMSYYLKSAQDPFIVKSSCLKKHSFYTAISPNSPYRKLWIDKLNKALSSKDAKILYQQAQLSYQLTKE